MSVRRVLPQACAVAALCVLATRALPAQDDVPPRPRLPFLLDSNDWEPYFDLGVRQMRRDGGESARAFYWASRLNPTRAEPLYARYVMFWYSNARRWERYLDGDEKIAAASDVKANDRLRSRALALNPFVHQGLRLVLFDILPGTFPDDIETRGWLAYAKPDLTEALRDFALAIQHDREKSAGLHYYRALCFVALHQPDSARAELQALLDADAAAQKTHLVAADESTEFIHYALGMLALSRGDLAQGRAEIDASMEQDLSYAPAHALLARLTMNQGDTATAFREFRQALELDSTDAVVREEFGKALRARGRASDAIPELERVVRAEPYWADAHYQLAMAYDAASQPDRARPEYETFVASAPQRSADDIRRARARLGALPPRG